MNSIANELIVRGWTQGWAEDLEGRVCLYGAACYAAGIEHNHLAAISLNAHADDVAQVLWRLTDGESLDWNDNKARTFDEVLRVAKEADEILSEQ